MPTSAAHRRRAPWGLVLVLVLLTGAVAGWVSLRGGDSSVSTVPTWKVQRGPLRITVTEGGSLQSLKSVTLSSEVEGETKIASIVPEGTVVTAEDVAAGKVLVELDSSSLGEKARRQAITVSDAQSGVAQAEEALKIQQNQNDSDLRKAELDVKFARIDLQRYVGARMAERVEGRPADGPALDGKALAADAELDGAALQERRKRESDIDLAREEVARARDKLKWTEELLAKGFVSADEQVADRLALKRQEVAFEQATTSLSLLTTYEFPKELERLSSDLREAKSAHERVRRRTDSALSSARADLKGKQERLALETSELQRVQRQIDACVIRARNPGLVIYASSEDRGNWMGDQSPIQQGATIRERQAILSIPDPKSLGVRVNVHESALGKVKPEQTAAVVVDAFPERPLVGRVVKMATLPSSANRWQNPDLKLYPTDVSIDDAPPDIRPGMSAKVEILVAEIPSTVYVPVQAVTTANGRPVVWVRGEDGDAARPVTLGLASDRFTQVLDGLREGELVLLAPPKEPPHAGAPDERREGPPEGRGRKGRGGGPQRQPSDGAPAAGVQPAGAGPKPTAPGAPAAPPPAPARRTPGS